MDDCKDEKAAGQDPEDGDRVTPVMDQEAILAMLRQADAECWQIEAGNEDD